MKIKLHRMISIATLAASVTAIFLVLKKPAPVAQPQAPTAIAANAQSFEQKLSQLEQASQKSQTSSAGYSQGANVAVGVAEAVNDIGDPNYLGAVSVAGVAQPEEMFERFASGSEQSMLVFLAQGVKTVFPEFRIEEILTEKALPLYQHVRHSCEARLGPEVVQDEMLKPGWENNPYVKKFWERNKLAGKPAQSPLLVISGGADTAVPAELTASAIGQLCEQKDRVLFVKYTGLNASGVLGNSVSEQISWIKARFSGLPAPSNCR